MVNFKNLYVLGLTAIMAPCAGAAQDWDGFYGGLTLGYAISEANHSFSNGAISDDSEPDGILYGGFVGYGVQSGHLVYGVELNIEGSNASGSYRNPNGIGSSGRAQLNAQGAIRGVLGITGNLGTQPALFYGSLGWAYADFDFNGGPFGGAFVDGYNDQLNGITLGLGIDTRFGNNYSLRTEYTYTDYGSANGGLSPGFPAIQMRVAVKQHAFRVGIRKDF